MARCGLSRRLAAAGVLVPVGVLLAAAPPGVGGAGGGFRVDPAVLGAAAPIDQQLGGTVGAVALAGTTAYVGVGPRVAALDVTDPGAPRVVAWSPPQPALVTALAVQDDLVFAAAGDVVVLGARGEKPLEVVGRARLEVTQYGPFAPFLPEAIAVDGDRVFVVGPSGLRAVDVSDPTAPAPLWSVAVWGVDLAARGGYVYVAVGGSIDGPVRPRVLVVDGGGEGEVLARVDDVAYATALTLVGDTLLVADAGCNLRPIDISEAAAPTLQGCLSREGGGDVLAAGDGLVMAIGGRSRRPEIWVGRWPPAAPDVWQAAAELPVAGSDMAVGGGVAVVAGGDGGLAILEVGDVARIEVRGTVEIQGSTRDLTVSGRLGLLHLWRVVDHRATPVLAVLDLQDPDEPQVTTTFPGVGRGDLAGTTLVAPSGGALTLVDLTDPGAPSPLAAITTTHAAQSVVAVDGVAVAVGFTGSRCCVGHFLETFDISAPQTPKRLGYLEGDWSAGATAAAGGHVYVAGTASGVRVFDVANSLRPREIATLPGIRGVRDMAFRGNKAYLAESHGDLVVVDVSRPEAPRIDRREKWFYLTGVSADAAGLFLSNRRRRGLEIRDPGDDLAPMGLYAPGAKFEAVASAGEGQVVVAEDVGDGNTRVAVLDTSHLGAPGVAGRWRPGLTGVAAVSVQGELMAVAASEGLVLVDAEPGAPWKVVGRLPLEHGATEVVAGENYVYVAAAGDEAEDEGDEILVVDVSNPRRPRRVGALRLTGRVRSMALMGGHLVAADGLVHVIDVTTDPEAPKEVATLGHRERVYEVAVGGSSVYAGTLACTVEGRDRRCQPVIRVASLEDPPAAAWLGPGTEVSDDPGYVAAMGVSASTLVVAVEDRDLSGGQLVTVRVAPGQAPGVIARHRLEGRYPSAVATDGRRAFLGASDGLWVFDLGGEGRPRPLGLLWTPGRWRWTSIISDMDFIGDQVVVADTGAGIWSMAADAVLPPPVGRSYFPAVGR